MVVTEPVSLGLLRDVGDMGAYIVLPKGSAARQRAATKSATPNNPQ